MKDSVRFYRESTWDNITNILSSLNFLAPKETVRPNL